MRNEDAQTTNASFENILNSSNRKSSSFETDAGEEIENRIFNDFLKKSKINWYSDFRSNMAVLSDLFNWKSRVLMKKPVFDYGNDTVKKVKWIRTVAQ